MRRAALLLLLASSASAARLHFDEVMAGSMRWAGAPDDAAATVSLHLRLATDDTDAFFADPDHPMSIEGSLRVRPAEGPQRDYPITEGQFLFLAPGAGGDERVMVYRLQVATGTGRRFWFQGVKTLRDDDGADAIGDTTRLASTLRRGGPDGPVVAAGELRFRWQDPVNMARFVGSFRVRGAGLWGKIKVLKRFLRLYLGTLARLYL